MFKEKAKAQVANMGFSSSEDSSEDDHIFDDKK